tara:strand:- start:2209 stop:2613 length:405 start_codon:yes stop_codon:yes gene_type:complete
VEIFNQIYILCAGLISGVIIFQSVIVASSIFTVLPEENAGILLRNLFPKFFLFLIFLSSFSLGCSFLANLNFYPFGFIGILGLLSMSVCYFIIPKTNKARDEKNDKLFKKLHTLSVSLTLLVLFLNLAVIFLIS